MKPKFTIQEFIDLAKKTGHDSFYDGEVDDAHGVHGCVGETCTVPWHRKPKTDDSSGL